MRHALGLSVLLLAQVACLGLGGVALANDPPPKKAEPAAPPPPKPSSLTGNALPHCDPGQYPAGNICKPAPPGFYAPAETRFLVRCPTGKTSPAGSRAPSECL